MHPTDTSDVHLADRAIEIRALKAGIVVFLVALVAVYYSLPAALVVFVPGYVAYKYTYYTNRIGVFTDDDLGLRHNRLELGLLAASVVTLGTLLAVEVLFPDHWTLGGFLSLPPIDLTDLGSLAEAPAELLGWAIVLAPVVAVSYAGFQLRHRLLIGIDTEDAVIRASVWETLARIPVYVLWVGVLTTRPLYEVWHPVVRLGEGLGLTAGTTGEFAVLLGGAFPSVMVGGLAVPIVVIGSYLGIQRWKYDDARVPEVLGHHGIAPPSRHPHPSNVAVPVGVFLLYTLAVFIALDSPPIGDLRLVLAVVVSVLVGADYLGRTSMLVRSAAVEIEEAVDAIVTGFIAGFVALLVLSVLVGARGTVTEVALIYPVIALPLSHLGNRIAGRYAVDDIAEIVDDFGSDPDSFEEAAADRLFVYSGASDDTRRATAIDGLASIVGGSSYRREDALTVFVRATDSHDADIVHAGLRGITAVLDHDGSVDMYERLVEAGYRELVLSQLDSNDVTTQARASEAAARLFTIGLEATPADLADHLTSDSRIERMTAAVDRYPDDRALAGAVVKYFARVWYAAARSGGGAPGPTDDEAQHLLGGLVRLAEYADDDARLTAVLAVTSGKAAADFERFALAIDRLDNEAEAVRYLAIHVVRSSIDRHADRIDPQQLLELLDDPSEAVRQVGAQTIATFVRVAPDRAPGTLDRLVLHLQEQQDEPGLTEGHLIRALSAMDVERLIDHPTAAPAVASYIVGTRPPIAEPAAEVLSSIVARVPDVAQDDVVGAAIESGLTNPSPGVRLDALEAVVTIVDDSVERGRRFVRGLGENLSTEGEHGVLAAVCLAEVFEAFPDDGLDVLPALSAGLGNLTPVERQAVPFVVRGSTVSAVTVDFLVEVLPLDPGEGEVLIDPLTDVATTAEGAMLERVFQLLAVLSAEFPSACRATVGTAAAVVEDDRVGVRRAAAEVLANVAASHPTAVEPFVERLVVATDDDSQRVRAASLVALENVCTASPAAIEADIHRVIGLLDDDSAFVRERAARLIVTIARREPGIVQPAAETADRLRRLQRDPAVDVDAGWLQDASTAIQTGVPMEAVGEADHEGEEIWSPETAEEMGASGKTNVFVPGGDDFDEAFDTERDAEIESPDSNEATDEGASESADVEELETVVESNAQAAETEGPDEVEELETVMEGGAASADERDEAEDLDTADEESETGRAPAEPPNGEDVEDLDTAIETGGDAAVAEDTQDDSSADVVDAETVIERDGDAADGTEPQDGVEGLETAIEPATGSADEEASAQPDDVHQLETAIEPGDRSSEDPEAGDADGIEDLETTIDPGDAGAEDEQPAGGRADVEEPDDVEGMETVIEPDQDGSESDDSDDDGPEEG